MLDRWVQLSAPTIQDTRVEIEIQASNRMEKFIESDVFFADYSNSIENVPINILTIPAVANIAPVCWATDADLFIDTLDHGFLDSLQSTQRAFSELYPFLNTSSDTIVNEVSETTAPTNTGDGPKNGLLFSGGIDSLTTLVRHYEKSPTLITLRGADVGLNQADAWKHTKSLVSGYAEKYDLENQFIESNCYTFLNGAKLSALFRRSITDGAWWGGVQHGMGLLGICAPIAYNQSLSDLRIASSYTEEFSQPWGSDPAIDNRMAWSGTACHHDGFELSRQQKISLLVSHAEQEDLDLPLRVCYESESGKNCSQCEKCCRTIVGLLVAGADPEDYGFRLSKDTLDHIRIQIESGNWPFGFDERYMWSDIQRHAPSPETIDDPQIASFYRWLHQFDPGDYRETDSRGLKRGTRDVLVRNLPYAYFDVVSLLYSKLKPS